MRSSPWLLGTLLSTLAFSALACGDGGDSDGQSQDFPAGTTCGLAIRTRGTLAVNLGTSSDPACLTQLADSNVIDVSFLFSEQDLRAAEIQVLSVMEGETGDFPALVALASPSGEQWESEECIATITEHELVGPSELEGQDYHVVGRLRCHPAQPSSAGAVGDVDITSLDFVATVSWL